MRTLEVIFEEARGPWYCLRVADISGVDRCSMSATEDEARAERLVGEVKYFERMCGRPVN